MIFLFRQMRKWTNFSESEIKPLCYFFWGPGLLFATLVIAHPIWAHPLLPFLVILSLGAVYRARLRALLLVCPLFLCYFLGQLFFGIGSQVMEALLQISSFMLGLVTVALSIEEIRTFYSKEKISHMKAISEYKKKLHLIEEKYAAEQRQSEKESKKQREDLARVRKEKEAYCRLVDASQIEAEKSFLQNRALSAESLHFHREITKLKEQIKGKEQVIRELNKEKEEIKKKGKARLQSLNWCRVEYFQMQLLVDTYVHRLQVLRSLFLKRQKKATPSLYTQGEQEKLKKLEGDKHRVKEIYGKLLLDYKMLEEAMKRKGCSSNQVEKKEQKQVELQEKKRDLIQKKSELVELEREIFLLRKDLQQQGSFVKRVR